MLGNASLTCTQRQGKACIGTLLLRTTLTVYVTGAVFRLALQAMIQHATSASVQRSICTGNCAYRARGPDMPAVME